MVKTQSNVFHNSGGKPLRTLFPSLTYHILTLSLSYFALQFLHNPFKPSKASSKASEWILASSSGDDQGEQGTSLSISSPHLPPMILGTAVLLHLEVGEAGGGYYLFPLIPLGRGNKKRGKLDTSQADSDWLLVFPAVDSTSWSESKE